MKITDHNAIRVAAYGASAFWIMNLICVCHDLATGDINSKQAWTAWAIVMGAVSGAAFYGLLAPNACRAIRCKGFARNKRGIAGLVWAGSPIPLILAQGGLLIMAVFQVP